MTLDLAHIRKQLGDDFTVEHHTELDSTNNRAMQLAREHAPGMTLVCADFQTAGRGRRGAPWIAPAGSSALLTLLVRPAVTIPTHHLAILSGVGVAKALQSLGAPAKIKWPNDIMVLDRKVAGILVETTGDAVVIGVGVNCATPEEAFPDDVRARAGSLHTLCNQPFSREDVMVAVVRGLLDALQRVEAGGVIKVLYDWNTLNWLTRHKVRVSGPMGVVDGDGLFLDGRKVVFHVFKDYGVVAMPLSSSVEAR